jgi:hypothetical protein
MPWWWPDKVETCRQGVYIYIIKTNCAFVGRMITIMFYLSFVYSKIIWRGIYMMYVRTYLIWLFYSVCGNQLLTESVCLYGQIGLSIMAHAVSSCVLRNHKQYVRALLTLTIQSCILCMHLVGFNKTNRLPELNIVVSNICFIASFSTRCTGLF